MVEAVNDVSRRCSNEVSQKYSSCLVCGCRLSEVNRSSILNVCVGCLKSLEI